MDVIEEIYSSIDLILRRAFYFTTENLSFQSLCKFVTLEWRNQCIRRSEESYSENSGTRLAGIVFHLFERLISDL